MTNVSLQGSIQTLLPVNPVCPKDPTGNKSPRLDEYDVFTSHPMPRISGAGSRIELTIRLTEYGESMRTPPYWPSLRIIWQKMARSPAVENKPACPATPPMA